MQDKLFELTKQLISFKSISPYQGGAIDYINEYLTNLGFITTRLDRGETSNLIARYGTSGPIFAYAGHIDVVPCGDIRKWKYDPFTLTKHDGMLYGRGISDMKGSVASFLIAVEQFILNHQSFCGSIMLLITSDEESVATDGTVVMVEYLKRNNIQIDYCLLGEPTSLNKLGDVIKIGRRGSLNGYLEIIGKQGHIAYPSSCKNPIHLFAGALQELTTIVWDKGDEYFPPTSLQFSNLNSGVGVDNVIPGNLLTSFNFRYNRLHTADSLSEQLTAILDKHCLNYNIRWQDSAKPFYTKAGKLIEVVTQIIKDKLHVSTDLKTDGGTSDGRFLVEVCNEILEFGLCNTYIHQTDERIKEADLLLLSQAYNTILNKILL